jgi:hypothetical protein
MPIRLSLPVVRRNEFYRVRLTGIGEGDDPVMQAEPLEGPAPFSAFIEAGSATAIST